MSTIQRRSRRAIPAALILAAIGAVIGAMPATAGTAPSRSAWVVVRKPTLASYTPAARDRSNTEGGAITVTRTATGETTVTIPNMAAGLSDNQGTIQVSALGSSPALCRPVAWISFGTSIVAYVSCLSVPGGTPVDSPYVLGFLQIGRAHV